MTTNEYYMSFANNLVSKVTKLSFAIIELVALVVFSTVAIISITEIASREAFADLLGNEINELNKEIASQSMNNNPRGEADDYNNEKALKLIFSFGAVEGQLRNLIETGTQENIGTLHSLTLFYRGVVQGTTISEMVYSEITNVAKLWINEPDVLNPNESFDAYKTKFASRSTNYSSFVNNIFFVDEIRSDSILAIAIMSCSAIGALIYGLRSAGHVSFRSITSGIATGFVVYLALKGGQHLFLLNSDAMRLSTNPYSSAFAGLLAGVFSDKAYKTLSSLVDNLAAQVENTNKRDA